jgi:low temperature requirement protein LtrA
MPQPVERSHSLFRRTDGAAKVTMAELFFDLVFVFAVTQLSHSLLARLTPLGALQTAMLLLAVWSLWSYTAWATNVLDPDRIPVRLLLFVLMLLGLVVSTSIPSAFEAGAWAFTIGYVLMHAIRCGFILWAARAGPRNRLRSFQRNLFWVAVPAPLWFAGAFAAAEPRLYWWIAAISLEFVGPWLLFWTPGLGSSKTREWLIDGAHMAERCALFVIIALGESLLITGATFAAEPFTASAAVGAASAFLATVAMWWIYFHEGSEHAAERIIKAVDPGRTARTAYSYVHIAIVAGIIVSAVADEIVLVHPGHADIDAIAVIIGGPALFLLGCTLFKWNSHDRKTPPLSHCVGLLALGVLFGATQIRGLAALQLGILTAAILTMVAAWETLALRRH